MRRDQDKMRHVVLYADMEEAAMKVLQDLLKDIKPGRRKSGDPLFGQGDIICQPLKAQGVYEIDDEELCHQQLLPFACEIPGCGHFSRSLLESEQHYSTHHRYECSECRKHLATPHLLDLHLCETHDSFFALLAQKSPSYRCFVEGCAEKFGGSTERMTHCVDIHHFPKDFRYGGSHGSKSQAKAAVGSDSGAMDVDCPQHKSKQAAKPPGRGKRRPRGGGPPQHLGSGGRGRGGSLNWYQRFQTPPLLPHHLNIDMQDLEEALPATD